MKKMPWITLCVPAFALLFNGQMSTAQGQANRSITPAWQQMSATTSSE